MAAAAGSLVITRKRSIHLCRPPPTKQAPQQARSLRKVTLRCLPKCKRSRIPSASAACRLILLLSMPPRLPSPRPPLPQQVCLFLALCCLLHSTCSSRQAQQHRHGQGVRFRRTGIKSSRRRRHGVRDLALNTVPNLRINMIQVCAFENVRSERAGCESRGRGQQHVLCN